MDHIFVQPAMKLIQLYQQSVWLLVSVSPNCHCLIYSVVSIVVTGHGHSHYFIEPNEINSLVSTEHNGTNMNHFDMRYAVDPGADHGYNPPTSSYQLPPEGVVDSYMILGNRMPLHNGGECACKYTTPIKQSLIKL